MAAAEKHGHSLQGPQQNETPFQAMDVKKAAPIGDGGGHKRAQESSEVSVKAEPESLDDYKFTSDEFQHLHDEPKREYELSTSGLQNVEISEIIVKTEDTDVYDSDPELQMVIDEEALEFSKITAGGTHSDRPYFDYDDIVHSHTEPSTSNNYENMLKTMTSNERVSTLYKCALCVRIWNDLKQLLLHTLHVHPTGVFYTVEQRAQITEVIVRKAPKKYAKLTSVSPSLLLFRCPKCTVCYSNQSGLVSHSKEMHPGVEWSIVLPPSIAHCKGCDCTFLCASDYQTHIRSLTCQHCEMTFFTCSQLHFHILYDLCVETLYCPCGQFGPTAQMSSHLLECKSIPDGGRCLMFCPCGLEDSWSVIFKHRKVCKCNLTAYECKHCHSKFFKETSLRLHCIKIHKCCVQCAFKVRLPDHNYCARCLCYCFKCNKYVKSMDRHMMNEHSTETEREKDALLKKRYFCQRCSVAFGSFERLIGHERIKHPKVNVCNVCNKNYTAKPHVCVTPFTCVSCKTSFPTKFTLSMHECKAASKFTCVFCQKSFPSKFILSLHEFGNDLSDETCGKCGVQLGTKCYRHMHSEVCGGNPWVYPCKQCQKKFASREFLVIHLSKSHPVKRILIERTTERESHLCDICDIEFRQETALRQHYQRVHPVAVEERPQSTDILQNAEPQNPELQTSEAKSAEPQKDNSVSTKLDVHKVRKRTIYPNTHNTKAVSRETDIPSTSANKVQMTSDSISRETDIPSTSANKVQKTSDSISRETDIPSTSANKVQKTSDSISRETDIPSTSVNKEENTSGSVSLVTDIPSTFMNKGKRSSESVSRVADISSTSMNKRQKTSDFVRQVSDFPCTSMNNGQNTSKSVSRDADIPSTCTSKGQKASKALNESLSDSESMDKVFKATVSFKASPEIKVKEEIKEELEDLYISLNTNEVLKQLFNTEVNADCTNRLLCIDEGVDCTDEMLSMDNSVDSSEGVLCIDEGLECSEGMLPVDVGVECSEDQDDAEESLEDFIANTDEVTFTHTSYCGWCEETKPLEHSCYASSIPGIYRCKICKVSSNTLTEYLSHYQNHNFPAGTCPCCFKSFRPSRLVPHIKRYLTRNYSCKMAELSIRYKQKLFRCGKCGQMIHHDSLLGHWESHILDSLHNIPLKEIGDVTINDLSHLVKCEDEKVNDLSQPTKCKDNNVTDLSQLLKCKVEKVDDLSKPAKREDEKVDDLSKPARREDEKVDDLSKPARREDEKVDDLSEPAKFKDEKVDDLSQPVKCEHENVDDLSQPGKCKDEKVDNLSQPVKCEHENVDDLSQPDKQGISILESAVKTGVSPKIIRRKSKVKATKDGCIEKSEAVDPTSDGRTDSPPSRGVRLDKGVLSSILKQLTERRRKGPMMCRYCKKCFIRMSDLKRHVIEHVVEHIVSAEDFCGIYPCDICADVFQKVYSFKKHMREHARLPLYQCQVCDKAFSDSSNFSKHKKVHGMMYMQCDTCRRKFTSRKMLLQHMEFHSKSEPLPCDECDRVFYFASTLRKHKQGHDPDRAVTFRCSHCTQVFANMKSKWDHQWLEHSVRKFKADCPVCDEGYRNTQQLSVHVREAHAGKLTAKDKEKIKGHKLLRSLNWC